MSTAAGHAFAPTRWSLVARATEQEAPAARAALDELCRIYWPPLCAFARRWGLGDADAEDVTQNFFAELLRNDRFAIADRDRGKLRTFLLHSFTQRLKTFRERDPNRASVPLDDLEATLSSPATEHDFNREWAVATMRIVLARLESEYAGHGKGVHFAALRPLLSLEASGNEDYAAIALQLGMKEGAVRVAAHRLRQRFREVLFAVIAETLQTTDESTVRAEIGLLIESL